mmetsp:Transcript_11067/g.25336  ORF Transcript_11067/g.25336 Transcript_11067/m.25336 type:complete len:201 (-) Transcript_11067:143-745(-)
MAESHENGGKTEEASAVNGDSSKPAAASSSGDDGRRRPMPLKLEFGQLTEKNLGQLKKLNTATFPVHYKEMFYNDLLKCLDYSRLGYVVDVLVASICCRLEDRAAGGKALYIMTLSVLNAYQRRSLATQLIKWAIEKAEGEKGQSDDVREIYLHVQTSNEGALAFYKKFDFEVCEEIKNYYKKIDPPDCYVLRRKIARGS